MPRVLNYRRDGLPDGAIYVGRAMPRYRLAGSRFANPFKVGRDGDRRQVIERYELWLCDDPSRLTAARAELRGRDLCCWCAPLPCHADVLVRLVS